MEPVHIIGAGISGLGAAHYLSRKGIPSVIHEAGHSIGGRAAASAAAAMLSRSAARISQQPGHDLPPC